MPKPSSDPPESQVTPNPDLEKRSRRQFSKEYKHRIVAEADAYQHGELEATLERYRRLYNGQIPQKTLGVRTPVEILKAYYGSNPNRFHRKPHNPPGPDTYAAKPGCLPGQNRATPARSRRNQN